MLYMEHLMALLRVRRAAQLTLPAEVRRALKIKQGDYLEAQIVKEGVLLKPVSVVARARAWAGITEAVSRVRDRKPSRAKSLKAEEQEIAREVKRMRRAHA
jgi:AbrB family looped-hinge helix DNA binding protein